jgi:PAS domain S-box-containing protein
MPKIGAPHRALKGYVFGIAGLAILLLTLDLSQSSAEFSVGSPLLFFVILLVTIGAEHVSFRVHRGWISAAATLPHVTAMLLFLPGQAEAIGLVGALSYSLSTRAALPKLIFNAAVVTIAVGAGAHVALAFGGPQLIAAGASSVAPLVALMASLTYYVVSVATVSVAVALDQQTSPWPLARAKLGFLALADLGLGLTGAVLAIILTTAPVWAPALVLPAALVYLVKRSHERLATSEARLEAIVASAMDAIITLDDERRIVVFNHAAEAMFGYRRNRVLGQPVVRLLVADPESATTGQADRAQIGNVPSSALARRASGEEFPVEMTCADVLVQGQHLSTLILRDITTRRTADEERVRLLDSEHTARVDAERAIRLRDEFLMMAAHELRTPITSLGGYAGLLLRRLDAGDLEPVGLRRALEIVDKQSRKLTRLVSLLLDMSAIQAGALKLAFRDGDLAPLVEESVVTARAAAPNHTFTVHRPETLVLSMDAQRLQQVLNNLLENAIRFSPRGGRIDVSLSCPDASSACLEVRDHGLGVSPEHDGHLFDGFYRAHADSHTSGLGLGLHVSRYLVQRHGGTIEVSNAVGGGTCFVVRLPTTAGVATAAVGGRS